MKVRVKRACGHEERVEVFGPERERQRRLEREAERLCRTCWEAAREREAAEAAEAARQAGLPELQGTSKQVAWAESIRAQKLRQVRETWERELAVLKGSPERIARARELYRLGLERLEAQAEARFWIDSRADDPIRLIRGQLTADEVASVREQ